jgi:predicted phage tail protein
MTKIIGAGKKKSPASVQTVAIPAARTPTVERDSLQSSQYVTVLDLLSEGEIQGLKNGLQSIFLNNTPIQNPNGTLNFQNVTIYERNGTQNQSVIPIASDIQDERPVNVNVLQAVPIVRTITDTNVNAARVTITVPQLQRFTNQGDIFGTSVRLQIAVQYNGGGFTTVIDNTISGRTPDAYQRDYLVAITGAFPVEIRVTRVTPDSADPNLQNAFNWTSYTEIIYAKLRYPNSALVGLRVDAEQFNSVPERSYLIRGIKVRIPNNATVDSTNGRLTYAGVWNGTFGAAQWTSDPAWILFDLLTSTRYGFGNHIQASQLDKFAFFSASQYASALVPTGFGGREPRFSCNINIQTKEEAYKLINDMCSVFRAMPFYSIGSLTLSQDRPADSSYLFTLANVSEEGFSYSGSSLKNRPNVAVVSYLDIPSRDIAYEVVEDYEAIAKYGVVTTEISAFACTSRGQASRIGEWLLYSEQYEGETCTFTASIDAGVQVRPGQIIDISDPVRAGSRRGGRIAAATTTAITVDNSDGLPTSGGSLWVILPSGTVEFRTVSSRSGAVITVSTAFTAAPNVNSVWIYQTNNLQASQWRVITVSEQDGSQYAVTALSYDASKYNYIERGRPLMPRDITNLNVIPLSPTNLAANEVIYENNGRVLVKIIVSWQRVNAVNQYRIRYRKQFGNWQNFTLERNDYEILDTTNSRYEIQVYSLNAALQQSVEPANLLFQAVGKTAVPGDVQDLSIESISANSARLRWTPTADLDVRIGGRVHIRHSSLTDGTGTWSNSIDLIPAIAGYNTEAIVPLVEGEIIVKFEDDGGRQSVGETSVIMDFPDALGQFLVQARREDADSPPFQGVKTDTFYSDDFDGLVLDGTALLDAIADFDLISAFDYLGDVQPSGEYAFLNTLDLEAVYALDLKRFFVTRGFYPNDLIDSRTANIDTWTDFDGAIIDKVNAKLYMRRTPDDPAASPTYSAWQEFVNGTFIGRGFQFKAELTSAAIDQNIIVDELGYEATFQRRQEQSAGPVASGAGTATVTYDYPFFTGTATLGGLNVTRPSVGIVAQDMNSGDYFRVTNSTGPSFQVTFFDSSNTPVSRNFLWTAVGYGKGA